MKLLLDTHCWLWWVTEPTRLGSTREAIANRESEVYLSAASAWEMAIKHQLGKLPLPESPEHFIPPRLVRDRITPLAVSIAHVLRVAGLPLLHRDPFDRLLVAQAQLEGLTLVTADRSIAKYDVPVLLV